MHLNVFPYTITTNAQNMGITVNFHDDGCAIITMRNGQNRWNPTSLKQFKEALDEVER